MNTQLCTASVFAIAICCCQIALCEEHQTELRFTLKINTDALLHVGVAYHADPPVEISKEMKYVREEGDYRVYDCKMRFSRKLTADENQRFIIEVCEDERDESQPLDFSKTFAAVPFSAIKSGVLKIDLIKGNTKLSPGYKPGTRVYCKITSGKGYRWMFPCWTDDSGKINLAWQGSTGKSSIAVINADAWETIANGKHPDWKVWSFDLKPGIKPVFDLNPPSN